MKGILRFILIVVMLSGTPAFALEITSVAPTRAPEGTLVVLTGGIFSEQSRIYVGEQFVAPRHRSARQMEFIVPALPPGYYSLTVQDNVSSAVQPFDFEVMAPRPQISDIDPDNLDVCADAVVRPVRVKGNNFSAGALLLLGGTVITSQTLDSSTLEFRLPEMPAGVYGLEVRNPDGATSLPHSLWINSVPEIMSVESGDESVNHYEVIVRGKNFFYNSILVVTESDAAAGSMGTRQTTYRAQRSAANIGPGDLIAPGELLRYNDCRTLVYLRYPSSAQDKELTLQVINPDGKKTAPYQVSMP